MIVFSAFTPHSPLLLPAIGKDNLKKIEKTSAAMKELAVDLLSTKPDVIVVISAHNTRYDDAFAINLHDEYMVDLKDFGDMSTQKTFYPDLQLIDNVQRAIRKENISITLESDAVLDHGTSIPLLLLTDKLETGKIVPLSYSGALPKQHVEYGRALKDVFMHSDKRIAIIATGDLSHALSSDAPMGFKKEGKLFDDTVISTIEQLTVSKLLTLEEDIVEAASECAYHPLLILMGILERSNVSPKILSYEAPFGVGYLVANFKFD